MIEQLGRVPETKVPGPGEKKEWEWMPCVYDFKQEYDGRVIIWNFSPYVMLSADDFNVVIDYSRSITLNFNRLEDHLFMRFSSHCLTLIGDRHRAQHQHRNGQDVPER